MKLTTILFALLWEEFSAIDVNEFTCRKNEKTIPHQEGLWGDSFPTVTNLQDARAICAGDITLSNDGDICIDGRVNYNQLRDFVEQNENFPESYSIYSPAAGTISINGHLITGAGNVVNGPSARILYDFMKSYTINGTTYTSNATLVDKLLTASQGTIDNFCLDSSIAQPETFYRISHKGWSPSNVDTVALSTGSLIFASRVRVVSEYHEAIDEPVSFLYQLVSWSRFQIFHISLNIPVPQFVYNYIPVFDFGGILRSAIVGTSVLSTFRAPQPIKAPPLPVEDIELEVDWPTFLLAVGDGIFADLPSKMSCLIKRIEPDDDTFGCHKQTYAAIDFQMPRGFGDVLDNYVEDVFYPKLLELNSDVFITAHFGKRLPVNTKLLQAVLDTYESCGATLDYPVEKCYHPFCKRTVTPTDFEYPEKYYDSFL